MADVTLSNVGSVTGDYNSVPTTFDSDAVLVQIVNGLTIVKTADKEIWGTGPLTYTVTITNNAEYDYENVVFTDMLDYAKISFIDNSLKVNQESVTASYNPATGELTATLPETIAIGGSAVITFQVQQV